MYRNNHMYCVGIVFLFGTVVFSSIRTSNVTQFQKVCGASPETESKLNELFGCVPTEDDETEKGDSDSKCSTNALDDEKERVAYSYSFYHFISVVYAASQHDDCSRPMLHGLD